MGGRVSESMAENGVAAKAVSGECRQEESQESRVVVGLSDPKSPTNVGAVMRAAGCYGVDRVCYTGTRYDRAAKFTTDTHNASQTIPLDRVESFDQCLSAGMKVVCVELVDGATALPVFEHPPQALYIFGPEDGTLSQAIIDQADAVVYVPTTGCMNLAASVNVLLYDRLCKSGVTGNNDMIIRGRDRNNTVRVKTDYVGSGDK
jgi:tRNA(Leu) C34 or U34 (ribose-2'-O)-methylase TrmL